MQIGPYVLKNRLIVAPMAGVTDRPFRKLCKRLGAAMAVSEMLTSNASLWNTTKSLRRTQHDGEADPIAVQILGADPIQMAAAAKFNVEHGAQIIDINMGCPAKKVCHVAAGSALMRDEALVMRILEAVVHAVDVPVTLKMRTGWDQDNRNALKLARLAESIGIALVTVHGRTRADKYQGEAEYDTVRAIKQSLRIPVVANGDIDSPEKAQYVLTYTGADAIMIGRAAQGRPWIFREVQHYLLTGDVPLAPTVAEVRQLLLGHLTELYAFYGEYTGYRVARKHIAWYTHRLKGAAEFRRSMNQLENTDAQYKAVTVYFDRLASETERLIYDSTGEERIESRG